MKLEAKLEAKLGVKLGAKPSAKLEAKPGTILGTILGAILYMWDCAKICTKAWSEFMNQNTLKSNANPSANGLFCCSEIYTS